MWHFLCFYYILFMRCLVLYFTFSLTYLHLIIIIIIIISFYFCIFLFVLLNWFPLFVFPFLFYFSITFVGNTWYLCGTTCSALGFLIFTKYKWDVPLLSVSVHIVLCEILCDIFGGCSSNIYINVLFYFSLLHVFYYLCLLICLVINSNDS